MFSSFVKIKSKIEGTFWDLYRVGSFTCWNKNLSLKHSRNSVEMCISFSVELVLFQFIPLMLKSPRGSKCDGFLPAISCNISKSSVLFSLEEFGLRYMQPIIKSSPPDKFILHPLDSRKFPFCSISIAGMLFLMYNRTPLPLVRSELKHV